MIENRARKAFSEPWYESGGIVQCVHAFRTLASAPCSMAARGHGVALSAKYTQKLLTDIGKLFEERLAVEQRRHGEKNQELRVPFLVCVRIIFLFNLRFIEKLHCLHYDPGCMQRAIES